MNASTDKEWSAKSLFRALPGYPWLPCPICKMEGYPNETEGCDHTVKERAQAAHPSLHLPNPQQS